ncbi:MAG: serine hydrolase [Longimicrobiales bacterium]|nr:serine hydrolase [Longimicrobiales bacterium]
MTPSPTISRHAMSTLRHPGRIALAALALLLPSLAPPLDAQYVPPRGSWETRAPEEVGMDPAAIAAAVEYALANETSVDRDQEFSQSQSFGREPHGHPVGPFRVRGGAAGVIVKDGYIVAEWGDTRRVDMTHSVTKSFLSTAVGLAWADRLIPDLHAPVAELVAPVDLPEGDGERGLDRKNFGNPDLVTLFESDHNSKITWDHLLRQSSAWEGTLWGKPDWSDRPSRTAPMPWNEERAEPGSAYEYNDTRVNLLALAATSVVRRPLPELVRERVMDPIGASPTWRWHGYDNSWIPLDGSRVQVVSGGGHWGGGLFISARDQARFGLFTLRRGTWAGEELLPEAWFDMATTPGTAQGGGEYGFMNYFLNVPNPRGRKRYPSAPAESWAHLGNGTNMVYVDPVHDLVVVARWIPGGAIDPLLEMIIESIRE